MGGAGWQARLQGTSQPSPAQALLMVPTTNPRRRFMGIAIGGAVAPICKRPLPALPTCVAVVASPTGAVIRYIVHVAIRRFPRAGILVVPCRVQGADSVLDILLALQTWRWCGPRPRPPAPSPAPSAAPSSAWLPGWSPARCGSQRCSLGSQLAVALLVAAKLQIARWVLSRFALLLEQQPCFLPTRPSPQAYYGKINIDNLGGDYPMLAGNITSIMSSLIICGLMSLWRPQNYGETAPCGAGLPGLGARAGVAVQGTVFTGASVLLPASGLNPQCSIPSCPADWKTTREIPTVDEDASSHGPMTGESGLAAGSLWADLDRAARWGRTMPARHFSALDPLPSSYSDTCTLCERTGAGKAAFGQIIGHTMPTLAPFHEQAPTPLRRWTRQRRRCCGWAGPSPCCSSSSGPCWRSLPACSPR